MIVSVVLCAARPALVCAGVNVLLEKPLGKAVVLVIVTLKLLEYTPTEPNVQVINPVPVVVDQVKDPLILEFISDTIAARSNVPSNVNSFFLGTSEVVGKLILKSIGGRFLLTPVVVTLTVLLTSPPKVVSV